MDESRRVRALREDVVAARKGRAAAAPLARELIEWHARAAKLHAKVNHLQRRYKGAWLMKGEIEALIDEITAAVETWKAGLSEVDTTGRVADAARSAQGILANLKSLAAQASAAIH